MSNTLTIGLHTGVRVRQWWRFWHTTVPRPGGRDWTLEPSMRNQTGSFLSTAPDVAGRTFIAGCKMCSGTPPNPECACGVHCVDRHADLWEARRGYFNTMTSVTVGSVIGPFETEVASEADWNGRKARRAHGYRIHGILISPRLPAIVPTALESRFSVPVIRGLTPADADALVKRLS